MKTVCFSFLAGAVVISGAVVASGWRGFAAGFIAAVVAQAAIMATFGARKTGIFLVTLSDALHTARSSSPIEGNDQATSQERDQVYSALRNLGEHPRSAARLTDQAISSGAKGFENVFRVAVAQRGKAA